MTKLFASSYSRLKMIIIDIESNLFRVFHTNIIIDISYLKFTFFASSMCQSEVFFKHLTISNEFGMIEISTYTPCN